MKEQLEKIRSEALAALNQEAQSLYSVSVTPLAIIDAMTAEEIPNEMKSLVATLQALSADKLTEGSVGSA